MAVTDLSTAAGEADIISCATLSEQPLIRGAWLKPGTHLDLVGAFKPSMRETDDEAVKRACIFVDTRMGALKEGGDLVQPLQSGVLTQADILAELSELVEVVTQGFREFRRPYVADPDELLHKGPWLQIGYEVNGEVTWSRAGHSVKGEEFSVSWRPWARLSPG